MNTTPSTDRMTVIASILATLQPVTDLFVQRFRDQGWVRLDMGLLNVPGVKESGIAADALLSHFRAVAKKLNPSFPDFAPAPAVVRFVLTQLPMLQIPRSEIKFIRMPARPDNVDPRTGELRPLKATVATVLGTLPSRLSPQAQETNARLADLYGVVNPTPTTPQTPSAPIIDTGVPTDANTDDVI